MRLSHITLTGFKSFAKKTSLEVTHSVTGIVGPNGSGKSNIAEAIRFVLGEQSMKSMRTKLSTDLLYKGGSQLSPASKATVSLILDNKHKRQEKVLLDGETASFLVYDEITLSRTLYADGTSEYTINGAKVRLKDVHELLALAGIGSVQHLIISQGEADRILLASPYERRELLEDALGLRIYHIRLKESERKLEKVRDHMREVDLLRKEIAPQLSFLHREVNKLEKLENDKKELSRLFAQFAHYERRDLQTIVRNLEKDGDPKALRIILQSLEKEMSRETEHSDESASETEEKNKLQGELRTLLGERDKLSRVIGRLEAEKVFLQKSIEKESSRTVTLPLNSDIKNSFLDILDRALASVRDGAKDATENALATLRRELLSFFEHGVDTSADEETKKRMHALAEELSEHEAKERKLSEEIISAEDKIRSLEQALMARQTKRIEEERHARELIMRHGELKAKLREQELLSESLSTKKEALDMLERECGVLAGALLYDARYQETEGESYDRHATLRGIERLKLRIEDAGLSNGDELKKEYETLRGRDEYLAQEQKDVLDSESKLTALIKELEQHIKLQFTEGIKTVSTGFNEMFGEIFKGGKSAIELFTQTDEEGNVESGIDIKVSLPEKRIRDLSALSGGEKALTSIALSFAMSQISPPPFMVLDETDAALDESNAKKYGILLTRLAKNSKLLVITHNRETMSHCDMLYGVTIGSDGASKLLSISFGQAETYTA